MCVKSYSGLKTEEVEELEAQLQKKAYEFAQNGMVVMLELCQHTQVSFCLLFVLTCIYEDTFFFLSLYGIILL